VELDIRPVTPIIGAEVRGLDLSRPLGAPVVAAVRAALCDRLVLFFPDQQLSPAQHADLARQFGELTEAHPILPALDEHPEVLPIDSRRNKSAFWHTDVTFMAKPPMGTLLYGVDMPGVGGDTLWASLQAAYDALSAPMRAMCDELMAVHWDPFFAADVEAAGGCMWYGRRIERLRPVLHPVVREHPETGRRGLFVNRNFTTQILGMSPVESDGLLQTLYRHCETPEFALRHRWEQGTVAFWDNRATIHYATDDYGDDLRIVHRVTLRGDLPYGPARPKPAGEPPAAAVRSEAPGAAGDSSEAGDGGEARVAS
jgi:alpha-ketoglutarate-dependent taurine dioxygenase